jgi:hypothetical protein
MKENEEFEGILISLYKRKNYSTKNAELAMWGGVWEKCGKRVEKYCISSCNASCPICLTAGAYVQQSTMILVHHPLHSTRSIGNSQTISVYINHQVIESGRVPPLNCQSYEDGSEPVRFFVFWRIFSRF